MTAFPFPVPDNIFKLPSLSQMRMSIPKPVPVKSPSPGTPAKGKQIVAGKKNTPLLAVHPSPGIGRSPNAGGNNVPLPAVSPSPGTPIAGTPIAEKQIKPPNSPANILVRLDQQRNIVKSPNQ
ncbi:hypothetical protein DICVIV_13963 [Dictyocaulus viviparus]|uniref:Uncharacterized protein n=1 Tax=Dictyocaulus viviparus TaxID=29172 RepID=A0A0D8X8Z5_DICVI|nr:hypothetical protein DICVIV_13963 [Dictyocaulus viviparus]